MRQRTVIFFFLIVLMAGFVMPAAKVSADAILFPWIVKADTVSTYISIINTAQYSYGPDYTSDFDPKLYYHFWYKTTTGDDPAALCESYSFMRPTSWNDIVTFDVSGITNNGLAIFNDDSPYGDSSFKLPPDGPRRGFLIVNNNTDHFVNQGSNIDGTLYGEALILDHATGMMWGYTAFNARGTGYAANPSAQLYFNDGSDYQGEVIGGSEASKVVLLPFSEYMTKFFVTPIGMTGQRSGNINARVSLVYLDPLGDYSYGGLFLNNEEPLDFTKRVNVTCTAALTLQDLLVEAIYAMTSPTGKQMWSYIRTYDGTATENTTSQAVIGKLEWKTVTQTVSPDLSDTEGCTLCKEGCISKCKKPGLMCQYVCSKKCKNLCSPKIEVETEQGNFNWIRNGNSLPLPVIAY